jgi:hypothetical protein
MQYPANLKPLPEDQGPGGGLDPLTPNSIVTERFQNPERFRVRLAVPPDISSRANGLVERNSRPGLLR